MLGHSINRHGVEFVAGWEQFVPWVYDDKARPVRVSFNGKSVLMPPEWRPGMAVRGTLTIGFGHTDAAKHPLKIKDCIGKRITLEQAYEILDADLDECEDAVNRLVKVPLTQNQFNALVSLVFNMGATNFRKSSLLAKLNRGDYAGARAAFDLYVKSGGEFMRGLQNRRDGEQRLWDEASPEQVPVAGLEADFQPTPKGLDAPQATKSMAQSTIGNSQIVIGGGTLATTAAAVTKEVMKDDPHPVEKVTQVMDQAGQIVSTSRQVVENIPDHSMIKNIVSIITDPVVLTAVGVVVTGLCIYTWFERRRHAREGNF